jgi:hypothetical protein
MNSLKSIDTIDYEVGAMEIHRTLIDFASHMESLN